MYLQVDGDKCTGCQICQNFCALNHAEIIAPKQARLLLLRGRGDEITQPLTCQQCAEAWCAKACPVQAIHRDAQTGALLVDESACTGCGACERACPFGMIVVNQETRLAEKCDLCGGDPLCAKMCPTGAITVVTDPAEAQTKSREGVTALFEQLPDLLCEITGEKAEMVAGNRGKKKGVTALVDKIRRRQVARPWRASASSPEPTLEGFKVLASLVVPAFPFRYQGYAGRYLRVNLTEYRIEAFPLDEKLAEEFLGGNGIGTKILWDEVPPEVEPLSPENKLIVSAGPLAGTLIPNGSRVEFIAKSPLTGIYGDANAGGFFGPELKMAGYDFIICEGKAPRPVFLLIQDDRVELRDALPLWGKETLETELVIQKACGDDQIKVASIGPAGENLVRFAAINVTPQRSAARAGLGAVMGSKNLKAIAVRGTKGVRVAKRQEFLAFAMESHFRLRQNEVFPAVSRFGTPGIAALMNLIGRFPTKNFQQGHFEYIDEIDAEALREKFFVKNLACFGCPVACDKIYRVNEGEFAGTTVKSLEYETLNAFGAGVYNANLAAIIKGNDLADRLGLDTISAGRVISFAMELYEKGLLTRAEADGLDLSWGNYQTVLNLLHKIAYREGFGNLLAEGVRRAALALGRGAEYYAMEVKGQELAAQDGRAQQSMGLAHATSSRGADHLKAFPTIDETGYPNEGRRRYGEAYLPEIVDPLSNKYKAFLVKDGEDYGAVIDSLGNCKSGGTFVMAEFYWEDMARALELATGMPVSVESLKRAGERIYNLQRAYNVRHGITRRDDTLPRRLLTEPSPSQRAKGHVVRLEIMLEEYYRLRRWDPATGIPTRAKLIELGLVGVASVLYPEMVPALPGGGRKAIERD